MRGRQETARRAAAYKPANGSRPPQPQISGHGLKHPPRGPWVYANCKSKQERNTHNLISQRLAMHELHEHKHLLDGRQLLQGRGCGP